MTLLSRLLVLVFVALLPAIAIQAYNEFDLRRSRQIEVQNHAINLADLAAEEQRQIVQGIHQVLIVLSELPSIKARDGQACNAYLGAVKQRFPAFLTLVVTDLKGQTFCDPYNKPVNVSARAYFASILKTGDFTVGEFSYGLQSGRRAIQFALPFYGDDSKMGGIIIGTIGLDWLADYIAKKGVPAGAAIAIMDRNGTFLARYPDNAQFVGRKAPEKSFSPGHRRAEDIIDVDGVRRIVGYSALGDEYGGLVISFGLDKVQTFAEIQRRTQRGIFLICLSTSLTLGLISLGARRFIHHPLGQLVDAANRWRIGEFFRRVDIRGKSEIAGVAEAFNTMADALEHREQELSEAKERAEEAAARITMIFESTTDSVVIVDPNWRISYLNGSAWTLIENRNLIGMTLLEVMPDVAETEIMSQLRDAISEQRPAFVEVFCTRRNVWYAVNAFPSCEGIAIFLRDITEHKNAVEAKRVIEAQFHHSQRMESVGQLTGGVAHDFNNLLMVVSANLELIEDATDISKIRQYGTTARRAIDRGTKLTSQLLAFSRQQVLNPKVVDANQLICAFLALIHQAVAARCEVMLQTDDQLWLCCVDPALLETALLNLALNARDAMQDGGVLKIQTRNAVLDEKSAVAGCLPGSYVQISVADTGCGMTPEVRDRVFEPFFTTKEVGKGTGLGLSMVYGFVRQSGGHIDINSVLDVGTTIDLYLPKGTQTPDAEANQTQPMAVPAGSERILLVDDNEDLLDVTSTMLTGLGYQVSSARNGAEALEILHSGQEFELLLSDIVMPNGISGVELAREARLLREDIKILLTSGYAEDVLERHNAVGEFSIIDKPFRLADLARRLRSVLQDT
ncbi:ATP-binding protein [Bradyrhizobium sp. SYSU BS000235]|uniref:ATP-binding protein n=1 Tax=Bradyrhizobium sp. SYSU BS000235 TaxID=3411332 RepID=UPI003C7817EC